MLDSVIAFAARLGGWGYLIVALGAMLESSAFVGLVVPGETLVLVAGFLCAQGVFDLEPLMAAVAIGAAVGDNVGYELGRHFGRWWAIRHGRRFGLTRDRFGRVEMFFSRHGGKSVFLGRFIGFARALVPFVAGSARMRYSLFLFYNLLGAALWTAAVVLLGYFVGRAAEHWLGKATAVVGGTVVVVAAVLLLWRWLASRETEVKARWARLETRVWWLAAAADRVAPALGWLRRRLKPGGYLGLQFTAGVVVFAGAAWLFGGIAEDVATRAPLTVYDRRISAWFDAHQNPTVTTFMVWVSRAHDWPVVLALTAGFIVAVASRRMWRWVATAISAIPGGMLLNAVLKTLFRRDRPTLSELAATFHSYSFPSGHVMSATVLWGTLAVFLVTRLAEWRWRLGVVLAAFVLVALVAQSRVYLGVHYPSDVAAAAAEGVAWVALCNTAIHGYCQHRRRRLPQPRRSRRG